MHVATRLSKECLDVLIFLEMVHAKEPFIAESVSNPLGLQSVISFRFESNKMQKQ